MAFNPHTSGGTESRKLTRKRTRLLYEQRFTIEGARKHLESRIKPAPAKAATKPGRTKKVQADLFSSEPAETLAPLLSKVREELRALHALLK